VLFDAILTAALINRSSRPINELFSGSDLTFYFAADLFDMYSLLAAYQIKTIVVIILATK
jgi:hypothetical protein